MLKKVIYVSFRKYKGEEHCMLQGVNFLHSKKLRKFFFKKLPEPLTHREHFFQIVTKKPTRVIIKAPFHYKIGKHRLTLRSYRFAKLEQIPIDHSSIPLKMIDVITKTNQVIQGTPAESTSILQPQYTKLTINHLVDKSFFQF